MPVPLAFLEPGNPIWCWLPSPPGWWYRMLGLLFHCAWSRYHPKNQNPHQLERLRAQHLMGVSNLARSVFAPCAAINRVPRRVDGEILTPAPSRVNQSAFIFARIYANEPKSLIIKAQRCVFSLFWSKWKKSAQAKTLMWRGLGVFYVFLYFLYI